MTLNAIVLHDYCYCNTKICTTDIYQTVGEWSANDIDNLKAEPLDYINGSEYEDFNGPKLQKIHSGLSDEVEACIYGILSLHTSFPGETTNDSFRVFVEAAT